LDKKSNSDTVDKMIKMAKEHGKQIGPNIDMKSARIVEPKRSLEIQEFETPKPVESGIVTVNNVVVSDPRV
jgi:hypothetical protein